MKNLVCLLAFTSPFVQVAVKAAPNVTVAYAAIGITDANGVLPCVGLGGADCYGVPANNVVIQPVSFVAPGTTPTWYAVYQTANWAGSLTANFALFERGSVAQTATQTGIAGAGSVILLSTPQTIPTNGYVGPATLVVTTTATPAAGGQSITLKSSVLLQMTAGAGGTGKTVLLTMPSVGSLVATQGSGSPCVSGVENPCFGTPTGTVVFQPNMFLTAPSVPTFFALFQAAYPWRGDVSSQIQLIEGTTVVATLTAKAAIVATTGLLTTMLSGAVNLPSTGYSGAAGLIGTATATSSGGIILNFSDTVVLRIQ